MPGMFYRSQILSTKYCHNNTGARVQISNSCHWWWQSESVEALWSNGSSLCSLPDLPDDHYYHTQSGLVTCGGWYTNTRTSCYTLTSGVWTKSHTLRHERYLHSSWTSPMGIVLMGGSVSKTTTELLTDDGQSTDYFSLQYNTYSACSIQLEETVVITGGSNTLSTASIYSIDGWVEDLPDLLTGRYKHGCGHYINNNDKMVHLVTGGYSTGSNRLVSTEIFTSDENSWRQVGDLPTVPINGLRGVSFNNNIIMTGGHDYDGHNNYYDYVLSYNTTSQSWTLVGNMRSSRGFHAASVVPMDQIVDYCN